MKILKTVFTGLIIFIFLVLAGNALFLFLAQSHPNFKIGAAFSPRYAKELGLAPTEIYQDLLDRLKVKNFRLNVYWDEIEREESKFDFSQLDYYLSEAQKREAQVILAIGYKLPRWPECRAPAWLNQADQTTREQKQLLMLETVIKKYEYHPTVVAWQLENEPLLTFGICPQPDREFLAKEVSFVRSQTKKPIIITDSGELRSWITPMKLSDIFGTTLYRVVYINWWGNFYYPLPSFHYPLKSKIIRSLFAPQNQKTIISELQAEVWSTTPLSEVPISEQVKRFPLNQFKQNIEFGKKSGFEEVYLWGVEWWYFMAKNNHPEYLDFARTLF